MSDVSVEYDEPYDTDNLVAMSDEPERQTVPEPSRSKEFWLNIG